MNEAAHHTGAAIFITRDEWLVAAAKRSHVVEDLPEAIIDSVRNAKMDIRHSPLNRLMEAHRKPDVNPE